MSDYEDYEDYERDDSVDNCWYCGGRRYVVTCIDDICRGSDECMHGDGEGNCPECNRDGKLEWEIA